MTDSGGGVHTGACRVSHPDPCNDQESGRKREKGGQITRARGSSVEEGKWDERKKGAKKTRGSTCFNFSLRRHEGHGRGGRVVVRVGTEHHPFVIYLSHSRPAIFFFFSPPFPSFHASVLLFLASRGSVAKANKQWRLFTSASGE